jgi:alkanesulfonate monooxygenase SsuD/methylene tetrahydromethanopterin reductase-like flavin-dependent oxidoreductase (luciferase family)
MNYGFVLPGGSATDQLEQAVIADQAGWDGVFVWEAAYGVDAWALLSAMAVRTERVKLGTMLTPLPWRRPWKVASQVATLDQLSNGRAVVSVGLGATVGGLGNTGEELDRRKRAAMLDEGIDLMRGLWEGRLAFEGTHYNMDLAEREDLLGSVTPVQARIPVWVVGAWPRPNSLRRVLRCDGVLPAYVPAGATERQPPITPAQLTEMLAWLRDHGAPANLDLVMEGETPANDRNAALEKIGPYAEAGATWWIDARWELPSRDPATMRAVSERLAAGPPRIHSN